MNKNTYIMSNKQLFEIIKQDCINKPKIFVVDYMKKYDFIEVHFFKKNAIVNSMYKSNTIYFYLDNDIVCHVLCMPHP